ncbi:hypothetical protein L596_026128 [Steinernema carpocapsae]|uniref:Uncharacterized protein n=1 Tax=Steinernema carpocapsae TaxID=34508 RepID=A0A4U5M0H1_STECR|nr:hypothetical protein L596_026128 [Steinernema carpocapsae]
MERVDVGFRPLEPVEQHRCRQRTLASIDRFVGQFEVKMRLERQAGACLKPDPLSETGHLERSRGERPGVPCLARVEVLFRRVTSIGIGRVLAEALKMTTHEDDYVSVDIVNVTLTAMTPKPVTEGRKATATLSTPKDKKKAKKPSGKKKKRAKKPELHYEPILCPPGVPIPGRERQID